MPQGFKAGGRKKGTPNKKTQNLMELIEENHSGFDPVLELIDIYKQKNTSVDLKVSILKDITAYIYPKRKSVESNIKAEGEFSYNGPSIEELIAEYTKNND